MLSILMFLLLIPAGAAVNSVPFRAVWVSTVYNLDYPSTDTTDPEILKTEAIEILDNVKSMGLTAVILQVRPASDALYSSEIFPWSRFLTGSPGVAPSDGFDPLEFWIDEAHKRGLELHAWINPYRITKKYASEAAMTVDQLPQGHPAKENPSWAIQYTDGDLYFDPGIPAVRQLILNGVLEICEKYDVDGIHFDDYFYPGVDFDDEMTFEKYKGSFTSKDDWRRSNVDALVKGVHDSIKKNYPNIIFGISPFGIWANNSSNPLGSDTNGSESYFQHYADTRKWVKLGWLDYIAPQLYWHIGHLKADYESLVNWWADLVSGTDVALYIGHAAYKVENDPDSAWNDPSQLISQLELNDSIPEVCGSIFFRYGSIIDSDTLYNAIKNYYDKSSSNSGDPLAPIITVLDSPNILNASPSDDISFCPGDVITFSCTAPIGSIIKVTFNGMTFQMAPSDNTYRAPSKIYATTYTYKYTVPQSVGSYSLGNAVYSMRYRGRKTKLPSDGEIRIVSNSN